MPVDEVTRSTELYIGQSTCQRCDDGYIIVNNICKKCKDDEFSDYDRCVKCSQNQRIFNRKCECLPTFSIGSSTGGLC